MNKNLIWAEISKQKISSNIKKLKALTSKNVIFAPCLKYDAYGHGMKGILDIVLRSKIDWICVFSIEEAEYIRNKDKLVNILVLGPIDGTDIKKIINLKLRVFVWSLGFLDKLSELRAKEQIQIHLKVDTGLGRLGILPKDYNNFLAKALSSEGVFVEGVASVFTDADKLEKSTHFLKQLAVFKEIVSISKERGVKLFHCSNSASVIGNRDTHFNYIRVGLSIYGYYPFDTKSKFRKSVKLLPALTIKTKVIDVKKLPANHCIGYECSYVTKRQKSIAVLPIGYTDGFRKDLSNNGYVLIKGKKCKVLGEISASLSVVDIDGLLVEIGDEVVIVGKQGREEITAEEIADNLNTVVLEVIYSLCRNNDKYYLK